VHRSQPDRVGAKRPARVRACVFVRVCARARACVCVSACVCLSVCACARASGSVRGGVALGTFARASSAHSL
jgi:hypothetical protein